MWLPLWRAIEKPSFSSTEQISRVVRRGSLGNLFSVGQPVYYVQLNGILDVLDGFFVGVALAVTALERGAGNEKAIGVRFDDDRESNVLHDLGHYRSVLEPGKPEFVEGCETGRATHRKKSKDPGAKPAPGAPAKMVWTGGIEPPALLLGSGPSGLGC